MPTDDHALVNRATWDEDARNWVQRGREAWARKEPVWGRGNPESELHLLPDLAGLDAIELGCGTAYVSAWLMRRGARVIGLDNSSNQLACSRRSSVLASRSCTPTLNARPSRTRASTS
jgi:SAM-dependent methyltransferase